MRWCVLLLLCPTVWASRIEGVVVDSSTLLPLKRVQVALRPLVAGATAQATETDEHGHFSLLDIEGGKYSFLVGRDGYLPTSIGKRGGVRIPAVFNISKADDLTGITFQLQRWALVTGKIKYDDAEPATGVLVQFYREFHTRGRTGFAVAGSDRTNDLGEYRVRGLAPGEYFVAAIYNQSRLVPDATMQPRLDPNGQPLPETGYTTTFFPHTTAMAEASTVKLSAGQEVGGVDIYLELARKLRVRLTVSSGLSGQVLRQPGIKFVQLIGASSEGLPIDLTRTYKPGAPFTDVSGLTPGRYIIIVDAIEKDSRLISRYPVTLGEADIDDLSLIAKPEKIWGGSIITLGDRQSEGQGLRLTFEPRSATNPGLSPEIDADGTFHVSLIPDETYDIYADGLSGDTYLRSVRVGESEYLASGLAGVIAPDTRIQVILSTEGSKIVGAAYTEQGEFASGATVALIPTPPRGHMQAYRGASADEYGRFQIRGVPPGQYRLYAFLDEPPCDFYSSDPVAVCPGGEPMIIEPGGQYGVAVRMAKQSP